MHKLKMQLEGQIQEIVFFFSLLLTFSVFISGIFFLALTPDSVTYILGSFGSAINQALFSTFGYAYFYLPIMILHMGYVTNLHVFSFKDFKREYQVLSYSALAHIIILVFSSTLLSVLQIYFEIQNSELLNRGMGGFVGNTFGHLSYSGLGVYGSIIVLLLLSFATTLMAGFYELNDVLESLKEVAVLTKVQTVKGAKKVHQATLQVVEFLLKDHEIATTANLSLSGSKKWMTQSINKANNFFTDHFHINTNFLERNKPAVEEKTKVKKTVKKTVAKKATAARDTLKTLTVRKSKKKVISSKKSATLQ